MTVLMKICDRLAGDRLTRNIGWYGLAEAVVRVSRLVTTILLARLLLPVDFGIAAIALTASELIRVLASNGIGQTIIRAREDELATVCATAQRAIRLVTATIVALHVVVGTALAYAYARPDLVAMTTLLGCAFLVMPFGDVRYFLVMRAQRMRAIAAVTASQVIADNALTAILALCGLGAWAIVLPKLLTAPIWLWGVHKVAPQPPALAAEARPIASMFSFAGPLLVSEILAVVRGQGDKLIVGAMLGIEALGVYYFAFNAGLGLSLSLTNALSTSLYPHLAEVAHRPDELVGRFDKALRKSVAVIAGLIALQAIATFLYVPLVFGARWAFATPLVALLCLSAVAKPLGDASVQLLRAAGRTADEAKAAAVFTTLQLGALAVALTTSLTAGILALTAVAIAFQVAFALWARSRIAGRSTSAATTEGAPA